jgi:CheY-like chemotaxis protein
MNAGPDAVLDVLIVDDDPGDALLIQEFVTQGRSRSSRSTHVVSEGSEALRFVRRLGEFTESPRPRLVLLDLNLPGLSGLEVLAEIKGDDEFTTIPVVILSSSRHPTDVERSYGLHANAYIVKPVDLDDFGAAIRSVDNCFLRYAEPAPAPDHEQYAEHPVLDSRG